MAELLTQRSYARSLLRFSKNLERAQSYADAIAFVQGELSRMFGFKSTWVYIFSANRKYANLLGVQGPLQERIGSNKQFTRLKVDGDIFLEELSLTKESVVIDDARLDPRTNKEYVRVLGNRTLINVPILIQDLPMGMMGTGTFDDEGVHVLSEAERVFLSAIAGHLGMALDRIRLVSELKQSELKTARRLRYALALNRISDAIISQNDAQLVLDPFAKIIGETLTVDRSLVYKVSFKENCLVGLTEWLNPAYRDILSIKGNYSINLFHKSVLAMAKSRHYEVSYVDKPNPLILADNSFDLLHNQMGIKAGLWFPFAFYSGGYYLLILNQVHNQREWSKDDLDFLDSVSRQISIALEKIRMVEEQSKARLEIQWNYNLQTVIAKLLRLSMESYALEEILQAALEYVVSLPWFSAEVRGAIYIAKDATDLMQLKAHIKMPSGFEQRCELILKGTCVCGQLLAPEESKFYHHLEGDPSHPDGSEHYCIPIVFENLLLGEMVIYVKPGQGQQGRDQKFLATIADVIVGIIQRKQMEETLVKAENKYRNLVEHLPLVVYTADLGVSGSWTYVGPQIEAMLGFTQEEWLADPELWYRQIHPEDRARQQELEDYCALNGGTFDSDYRIFTREHVERWIRDTGQILQPEHGGPPVVQGILMDVTERKRAELEVNRYAQNTETMYELSQQIHNSVNLEQVCIDAHQAVQKMMPCDAFVVTLLDEAKREVVDIYLWDQNRRWPVERYPLGQGLTGYIFFTARPLRVNDWNESHNQLIQASVFGDNENDTKSLMAVPLVRSGGVCFGMISVQAYPANAYTDEHEQLLVTLTNQVSKTIDTTLLFNELQHSNSELSVAYDATIEGWSRAMDLRDKETEGHTERVTAMALRLATAIGLDEASLVHIRRGGLLHDIGKLGVPDSILFKQDDLSEEEWQIMRLHPKFAYDMLSQIPYLRQALDIPYCHHEKWDGTGYPRGLKGDEIPLAARIFAVADVWDALRSDRPYRKGWQPSQVRGYIREQRGKQFDPKVVDIFLRLTGEL